MLSGLSRCGICGAAMVGSRSHNWEYYRCSGRDRVTGQRSCSQPGLRLNMIELAIWNVVRGVLTDPERLAGVFNDHRAELAAVQADNEAERNTIAVQIEKLARRQFRLQQALVDPDLGDAFPAFRDDLRTTLARKRDLERRLEALQPASTPAAPADFRQFCKRIAASIDTMSDPDLRRTFLRATVSEIQLSPENITINFAIDAPAAIAVIDRKPAGGDDPGGMTTNCKPRQCAKIHRPQNPRNQSRLPHERPAPRTHRPSHHHVR